MSLLPAPMRDSAIVAGGIYHLRLYGKTEMTTMSGPELGSGQGGCGRPAYVRHHPVEPDPFRCQLGERRVKGAGRARRALPNLLAARFLVCLPARLFNGGCAGPHTGFFCEDTGT